MASNQPLPKNLKKRERKARMQRRIQHAHKTALHKGWPAPHPWVRVHPSFWHGWCARMKADGRLWWENVAA